MAEAAQDMVESQFLEGFKNHVNVALGDVVSGGGTHKLNCLKELLQP